MYDRDFDMPQGTYLLNVLSTPALGLYSVAEGGEGARFESPIQAPQYGVFFGCDDGKVRCLAASSGALLWRSVYLNGSISGGPVIGTNGRVYVTMDLDNPQHTLPNVFCFDQNVPPSNQYNKQPLWSTHVDGGCQGGASLYETFDAYGHLAQTFVYVVGTSGQVRKIRDVGNQGVDQWIQSLNMPQTSWIFSYPLVHGDGSIYTGSYNNQNNGGAIYGLDRFGDSVWNPANGFPNYRIDTCTDGFNQGPFGSIEGFPGSISVASHSFTLFFGTQEAPDGTTFGGQCTMLNIDTGIYPIEARIIRSKPAGDRFDPTPAAGRYVTGGYDAYALFFAAEDGAVFMTDLSGGDLWPPATAARMDHPGMTIASDGTNYVGCNDGTLYAYWGPKQ